MNERSRLQSVVRSLILNKPGGQTMEFVIEGQKEFIRVLKLDARLLWKRVGLIIHGSMSPERGSKHCTNTDFGTNLA